LASVQCEGCERLENHRVKKMPMFVADTSGTQTFCQTATEECCVKIMHIKARFLVVGISPTADPLAKRKETLPSVASVVAKITALLTALSSHLPEPSLSLLPSSA